MYGRVMQRYLIVYLDAAINYVICGKLQMWKQLRHFELCTYPSIIVFLIIFVFLIVLMSVLSYKSNKLDL